MGLNLIIDGNYHMHRSMHAYESKAEIKFDDDDDCARFMRKLAIDVAYAIKTFGMPSRVIWTIDNNSWRKKIDIDQNDGYKKNRSYDDSVNWKNFKKMNVEFGQILESHGCIVSNIDGFEGDDLMYFWSNKFYNEGEDCVLITGDRDINQLVKCNGKNYVVVFNDNSMNKKIVAENGFVDYINTEDEIDIFNMSALANNKEVMREVMKTINVEEINPNDVVYEKIVSGDSGDNVPPIVTWSETQKSGKVVNRKITEVRANKIREILNEKYNDVNVFNLQEYASDFAEQIKTMLKQDVSEELVKERLERNTRLVWLNKEVLPSELETLFESHASECEGKGHPTVSAWKMQELLKDTQYYSEENGPTSYQSDYFASMKPKEKKKEKAPKIDVDDLFKTLF